MKTKHSGLIMGPAAAPQAPAATKFWNMASTGDDEGEITLYGDVKIGRASCRERV